MQYAQGASDRAFDLVILDFMRIGGVSGFMQTVRLVVATNAPMSTLLYDEIGAQIIASTLMRHWLEQQYRAESISLELYEMRDKVAIIFDLSGLGLERKE